jgi:hypothetical protein
MLLSDVHTGESPFKNVHRFPSLCTGSIGERVSQPGRPIPTCNGIAPKDNSGLQCCATNLQPYSRVPLSPDVPIARSGLNSQGRSPQAPQSPGGFALTTPDVVERAQAVQPSAGMLTAQNPSPIASRFRQVLFLGSDLFVPLMLLALANLIRVLACP